MKISYRKLGAAEARDYREIRLECLRLHPENFGSTFEEQRKLPKLMFEQALEQPPDERFVIGAFDQQVLIGICGFLPFALDHSDHLGNTGTIIQVYVRSAYRGRNVGLSLVKAVLHEAFKLPGLAQVILGVRKGNISAIRVYEQAGFQVYHPETGETEVDENELQMVIRGDA